MKKAVKHVLQEYTVLLLKLLSQRKTRVLKYLRKIQLLHCSSISSTPPPQITTIWGRERCWGRERSSQKVTWKQWHHGESTSSHLRREILEAGIKVPSPFIDIQVSTSKVQLHNTYYAALFLSQGSSSWMHKPLWLLSWFIWSPRNSQ